MQNTFDVIIVGAGPAGSISAYELARNNIKVLVLEKEKFPRYKPCGGGITYKTAQLLPFSISEVVEKTIHRIGFSHNYEGFFQKESDKVLMYCLMRDKFDLFLLDKAISKGAVFKDSEKVISVLQSETGVIVKTAYSEYRSRIVIGADGANSVIGRLTGIDTEIIKGITLEAELKLTNTPDADVFYDKVHIDWGTLPGGYAWVFPKDGHVSVGVGGPVNVSKYLRYYYENILDKLRLPVSEEISLKAHTIPYRLKKGNFSKGNVLLTGDAAGLTDSLTGEGVYYAIRSGQIAAKVILEYLQGLRNDIKPYSEKINEEIMQELLAAIPVLNLFHTFPARVHRYVKDSDRAWSAFVRILRGEKSYCSIPDALGRWRFMWSTINKAAALGYRRNLRQFIRKVESDNL